MIFKKNKSQKIKEQIRMDDLVKQYGTSAFMYTQYPHKRFWSLTHQDKEPRDVLKSLAKESNAQRALLYIHIPYCQQLCYFCTCHMSITKSYNKVKDYLNILYKEIDLFAQFINDNNIALFIKEVHLGGGSPTFIEEPEFDILCDKLSKFVNLHDLDEFAIEVDPRRVKRERLRYYHKKGINRISLGIQDFDLKVQKAINRVQPPELIDNLLTPEIKNLFPNGVNFDIICGLPHQTPDTIRRTAEECLRLGPDRICLNFLHYSPQFAPHQKLMMDGKDSRPNRLPDFSERKILFEEALGVLQTGNYVRTGYDHFAKSTDKVVEAMKEQKMHWNSLGVTPGEYTNIIGFGISSESTISNNYFQNYYDMEDYVSAVEKGIFPVYRGHALTNDDLIRKDVIQKLRNYFEVDIKRLELEHDISFAQYFHDELSDLKVLDKDGIISFTDDAIHLSEFGRRFTNIVCRVFDTYYSGKLLQQDLGHRTLDTHEKSI
jgi:oxygen-independent coproporphyrinogen-3 oxidase